jgi:hypothetical protein
MIMQSLPDNLDQVVAGHVIDNIINVFFDYVSLNILIPLSCQVYPLTPCLHRPTFIASLTARLDKTDPVFFALTLTVLASTLVQVPRHLVNLEKIEIEALARRCVRVARAKMNSLWEVGQGGQVIADHQEPQNVQSSFSTFLECTVYFQADQFSRDCLSVGSFFWLTTDKPGRGSCTSSWATTPLM